jgi:M6 family metalloprotease-like protein
MTELLAPVRPLLTRGRWILWMALSILVAASASAAPLPAEMYPHPCFIPPVPQKHGWRPKLEPPGTIGQKPLLPVGGPAFGYHDWHLKRESTPGMTAEPAPRDTLHMIAILVDFEDQPMGATPHGAPADSVDAYFGRVLTFLNNYYQEVTDSLMTITWELSPKVYRLPKEITWYGDDSDLGTREAALVRDAVQAADPDVYFPRYTRFAVFHAGAGQEADVNNDSLGEIWSVFFRAIDFQYYLDLPPRCIPNEYSESCTGVPTNDINPATGDTFYVPSMVIYPETESQDGYEFGILGVIAHEFGHSFGLPDLYDTTGPAESIYADSQGIGAFGIMGSGIWNENGFYPAEMDAWSKFYCGWLRPQVIRPDATQSTVNLSLAGIENERRTAAVRIPMGGDEYLLIENRRHDYNNNGRFDFDDADHDSTFEFWKDSYAGAEFDWYLPRTTAEYPPAEDGSGLLIWHVDESIIRDLLDYNLVNADALHKGVDLEEADGIQDLDKLILTFEAFGDAKDSFWAPFAMQFTPHTEPNTDGYGNAHTGIWITEISGPAPVMTFKVGFQDPTSTETGDLRPGWPQDLPGLSRSLQPVSGDLDGNGMEEIVAASSRSGTGRVEVFRPDGTPFFSGTGPALTGWGHLRAEPILLNLDADPRPEIVWVSGDSVLAATHDGSFLDGQGAPRSTPVPYFVLPKDPGRIGIAGGNLEPVAGALPCGSTGGALADGRPEIIVPVAGTGTGTSSLLAIASPRAPGLTTTARVAVADMPGDSILAPALVDVDSVDGGILEIASSVRTATGGYLAVTLFDRLDDSCDFRDARTIGYAAADTVAYTAPVAGDLNRDGLDEIVVADSRGFVHAFSVRVVSADGHTKELGAIDPSTVRGSVIFDNDLFAEMPGWPVQVGTLADDALSLSDIDGDGYLEVLVFGPVNKLYALNYNGTSVLTLPVAVPAENRYTQPFLSPFALDLDGQAGAELLLPLPDGQVRGHDARGRSLPEWSYLGGGNGCTYPVVADLDHDGALELVTVEDVTVSVPQDGTISNGDQSPTIERRGRVVVREVSASGTATGPWPVYRHDPGRSARAATPSATPTDPKSLLVEAFVVPNPVIRNDAGFHYQIRSDVNRVTIEVLDTRGQAVRTLEGTIFPGTDNMVRWPLTNEKGNAVAPGMYFARFEAESGGSREVHVQPFVVVR